VKGKPCWAPGAAEYLESLLTGEEVAFEWGGGASTVWLAERVRSITTMETDEKWARWIRDRCAANVARVLDFQDDHYLDHQDFILEHIDLWVIDGYRRIDCLEKVEELVQPGDIVVMDDALDYAEHMEAKWTRVKRFAQPHPHAGIPINHAKYGALRNTVRKVHADTKETWVWRV
jgi:predicted O-methyltransferase YrrM